MPTIVRFVGFPQPLADTAHRLDVNAARLRIVVVDDDDRDRDRLGGMLARVGGVEVVGHATSVATGIAAVGRYAPDLVMTEAELPGGSGFDICNAIRRHDRPLLGMMSTNPRHAMRAFETGAIGYLLKPVDRTQLRAMLERAVAMRAVRDAAAQIEGLERALGKLRDRALDHAGPGYVEELWVRERGTGRVRIPVDAVDWIDAQEQYVCIHANGREHLVRTSLDRMMRDLDPRAFLRIHRSVVVRSDRIEQIRRLQAHRTEVILKDDTRLPIGRVYARRMPQLLGRAHATTPIHQDHGGRREK